MAWRPADRSAGWCVAAPTVTISMRILPLFLLAGLGTQPALAAPAQGGPGQADSAAPDGRAQVLPRPPELPTHPDRGPYLPVSDARLREPEPESWLMYRRTYDGWGFSPLRQIDSSNVADLVPVWGFRTELDDGQPQAPPIVNGETMFVTTADQVVALDAGTGIPVWRYVHPTPADASRPHSTNRGVALYEDLVYVGTLDARVVALEAATGRLVWQRAVADYRSGYYITMAPLVVNGKVIVGTSGGEHGVRGFIAALDATTGAEVWRWHTIPAPGEPGSATWPGDAWRTGGGAVWLTGTYDAARNRTYWGVGNGGPWTGDARPGDNLFTNSTVALDPDTGELEAYHQYHWNGSWDWDEAVAPLLLDVERGGRAVPALVHPGRDGYLWLLAREGAGIRFLEAQPFVHHNVFTAIDPVSGRPSYDPAHVPRIGYRALYCPSIAGGRGWRPEAFNPRTRLLYVPVINNLCSIMEGRPVEYQPGERFVGARLERFERNGQRDVVFKRDGAGHVGELQAWNLDTGRREWVREFPARGGSVLATAGDLVFFDVEGALRAFDARSGEPLWQHSLNRQGPTGVAVTYAVSGVQYVAVQFEAPARRLDIPGTPPAGSIVVAFALDCQC